MADKKEIEKAEKKKEADLERKVDELMSTEIHNEATIEPEVPKELSTAPLLPTDKLPDFGEKGQPNEIIKPTEPKPDPEPPAPTPEPPKNTISIEDPATNRAVDEIIAEESNQLLAQEDAKKALENTLAKPKASGGKIKRFFKAWWGNPLYRKLTIFALLLAVAVAAIVPSSRYIILNSAGVRASTSVLVLDQKTSQPLKNVEIQLSGQSSKTDRAGKATVSNIKLGTQKLVINKPAFAEIDRNITIGWGSNPLGEVKLTPTGSQYTFKITDYVSDKPVKTVEATSGEASATANEQGEIVLTVPNSKDSDIEISIAADNYRNETLTLPVSSKETKALKLVPARKEVFVSKRSGKYDVYKVYVDGKNEEKILAGTGAEREDAMALVPHPSKEYAAFVSTRGSAKNQDGFLLSTLTLINTDTNETTKIADSERIQVIGWIADRLVYVKITQGASAADTNRNKLMSYDINSDSEKELASTNYFNDVMIAKGAIYYSPAIYKVNGNVGLYKIYADGTSKQTVLDKEVWNLFRTSYDTISASVGQDWYDYQIDEAKISKANGPPSMLKSRVYVDSSDDKNSLWVDDRDGKGVLLAYDTSAKTDKTIQTAGGLKNPIRWLDNDHVIYRISNGQETADYVLSISGGKPIKINDVTNIAGIDRWYYY